MDSSGGMVLQICHLSCIGGNGIFVGYNWTGSGNKLVMVPIAIG